MIERIARALDDRSIEYMIIGGQAVLIYGEPRLTKDIDITIGIAPSRLPFVIDVCTELGLSVIAEHPDEFVNQTFVLPAEDQKSGFSVKFIFSESAYEKEALARVREVPLREYTVKYASAEDVIIHKVIASRPRDFEDITSVIRKNTELDNEYIMQWLAEFDKGLDTDYVRRYEQLWADSVNL